MKTLLTITVLVSSFLSIFSSSLKLYEVPVIKEVVSVVNEEMGDDRKNSKEDLKRIYISHDVSDEKKQANSPILSTQKKQNTLQLDENSINVFGVKVPNKSS